MAMQWSCSRTSLQQGAISVTEAIDEDTVVFVGAD
jgi:hypothetical protein